MMEKPDLIKEEEELVNLVASIIGHVILLFLGLFGPFALALYLVRTFR